jgi:hypothetical protein
MWNMDQIYIHFKFVQKDLLGWLADMKALLAALMVAGFVRGEIFMVVEYDTNGTARPMSLNINLKTVELHVTVLGCDTGYYAETNHQPSLVCKECVCSEFAEGRSEAFVEAVD